MLKRLAFLAYGVACYAVFLATFLYAVGFVGGFVVPTTLDGPARDWFGRALAIDLGLLTVFAIQHSVMARTWWKERFTRLVPSALERSTYVLLSSLALILLFAEWRPLGGVVWNVTATGPRLALLALFAFGWGLVLVSTFLINHFDLFGLRQVWLAFRGRAYTPLRFGTPGPYKLIRHPLYLGWFFAFWATPTMTAAHLLFAAVTAAYILVAIQLEERDLVRAHGESYLAYRRAVPMLVPSLRKRTAEPTAEKASPISTPLA